MEIKKRTDSLTIPQSSSLSNDDYLSFLENSLSLLKKHPQYLSENEGIDVLELAHLIPQVPETILSIYIGVNDAVCNKGLVTPFLPRHSHNNVFVYDPEVFSGQDDIPSGTIDAKAIINGFVPPNKSWNEEWTYVMISDPKRTFESLWNEKGIYRYGTCKV